MNIKKWTLIFQKIKKNINQILNKKKTEPNIQNPIPQKENSSKKFFRINPNRNNIKEDKKSKNTKFLEQSEIDEKCVH